MPKPKLRQALSLPNWKRLENPYEGTPIVKVVRGLEAGREALCSRRGLGLDSVPPHVEQKTVAAFGEPLTPVQMTSPSSATAAESPGKAPKRRSSSSKRCAPRAAHWA